MRMQHISKVFILLLFSTAYMLGFSHYGSLAINNIIDTEHSFEDNTIIGSVDVSNKTKAEANELIRQDIDNWKKTGLIEVTYKETRAVFDKDFFIFNVEKTIEQAKSGQQNEVQVELKKTTFEEFIPTLSSKLALNQINKDKLSSDLLTIAAVLNESPVVIRMETYMDGSPEQKAVISKASIDLDGREREIRLLINALPELEIPAKTQVSLVEAIKAVKKTKVDKVTSGIFATAIYEAIMPTNFAILERNISRELPEYAKLGYEARIDVDKQVDLMFSNPNDTGYTLAFTIEDSKLVVTLNGAAFLYQYNLVKEEEMKFKPKVIKQYSALLKETESKVSEEGKEGLLIRIVRKTIDEKGEEIFSEPLSDDFYSPIHRIIITGLKEPKVEVRDETVEGETEMESGETDDSEDTESSRDEDPAQEGEPSEEKQTDVDNAQGQQGSEDIDENTKRSSESTETGK